MLELEKAYYKELLSSKTIDPFFQDRIFAANDEKLNILLLRLTNLKPEIDKKLSETTSPLIFNAWLKNPDREISTLNAFAIKNKNLMAAEILAKHPLLSLEAYKALTDIADWKVANSLVTNFSYPESLFEDLALKLSTQGVWNNFTTTYPASQSVGKILLQNYKVSTKTISSVSNLYFEQHFTAQEIINYFYKNFSAKDSFARVNALFKGLVFKLERTLLEEEFLILKDFADDFKTKNVKMLTGFASGSHAGVVSHIDVFFERSFFLAKAVTDFNVIKTFKEKKTEFKNVLYGPRNAGTELFITKCLADSSLTDEEFEELSEIFSDNPIELGIEQFVSILSSCQKEPHRVALGAKLVANTNGYSYSFEAIKNCNDPEEAFKEYMQIVDSKAIASRRAFIVTVANFDFNWIKYIPAFLISNFEKIDGRLSEELFKYLKEQFADKLAESLDMFFATCESFEGNVEELVEVCLNV